MKMNYLSKGYTGQIAECSAVLDKLRGESMHAKRQALSEDGR